IGSARCGTRRVAGRARPCATVGTGLTVLETTRMHGSPPPAAGPGDILRDRARNPAAAVPTRKGRVAPCPRQVTRATSKQNLQFIEFLNFEFVILRSQGL